MPTAPDSSTARTMARGMVRCGCSVSSARLLAASKPTMVYAPSSVASMNGPSQA
jgi:hypothetical protein